MLKFPPLELADDDGLLCMGGDLSGETLRCAYHHGIFPWPFHEAIPVTWFAPPRRGVLFLDEVHVPKSVRKLLKQQQFICKTDTNFKQVIRHCANQRADTWITSGIMEAYQELHQIGAAHSVEAYDEEGLAGGLYGVSWGKYFCGESMFHLRSGASKAALVHLIHYLQAQEVQWIDIQNMSPLFELFGAREISRPHFMHLLDGAITSAGNLFEDKSKILSNRH